VPSSRSVRLVVFDLDGTLVDASGDLAGALNATLAQLFPGTSALSLPAVRSFIGEGARVLVARSLAAAGVSRPPEEVLPVFLEHYRQRLLDTTCLYPGVADALERLRPRPMAVLTNKPGDMSRAILQGLGVLDRFFRVYGGGDLKTRKPDPEGLLRLLDECGARPQEAVMIGDSAIDVRTGRAAGVATVGVTYGFDGQSFQRDPPDLLVHDPRELPERLDRFPPVLG
jgi:phosphoglycolate phosphatase